MPGKICPVSTKDMSVSQHKKKTFGFKNSEFDCPDLESIYQHYLSKRRKTNILFLLVLYLGFNIIVATVSAFDLINFKRDELLSRLCIACTAAVFTSVFIGVWMSKRKRTEAFKYLPFLLWLTVYAQLLTDIIFARPLHLASDAVTSYMFFIYVTYGIIAFRLYTCVILCLLTSLTQIAVVVATVENTSKEVILQIISNILLYLGVNCLGGINHVVAEANERKLFLDTRDSIQMKIILNKEETNQRRLLESILPPTLAQKIIDDMKQDGYNETEGFKKIYIQNHQDCSILFADIVGFTEFSSTVSAEELIVMLNELFANFDKIGNRHNCQRIKILGDCYYCISGIEKDDEVNNNDMNHAENSVEMGLAMVQQILIVRKKTKVDCLNMRVGIHSGHVLAGILGLRKWQFDVWSDDVTLANNMESGGVPGRVHVSINTYELIKDSYECEEGSGGERCEYLRKRDVKTYLVKEAKPLVMTRRNTITKKESNNKESDRVLKISSSFLQRKTIIKRDNDGLEPDEMNRHEMYYATYGVKRTEYEQIEVVEVTDIKEEQRINKMLVEALQTKNCGTTGVANMFTLKFYDVVTESEYYNERKSFRMLSLCSLVITCIIIASVDVTLRNIHVANLLTFSLCFLLLFFFIFLSYSATPRKKCLIASSVCPMKWGRHYAAICDAISFTCVVCVLLTALLSVVFSVNGNLPSQTSLYFLYIGFMVFIMIPALVQLSYVAKVFLLLITSVAYTVIILVILRDDSFLSKNENSVVENRKISAILHMLFFLSVILFNLRQSEWASRILMLWKKEAFDNKEGVESVRQCNDKLMQNILPMHVIEHFLKVEHKDETELYSKSYKNVGVIFASIPNFSSFYTEESFNQSGIECMRVLNEIISDFDEVLSEPQFTQVEKIKTVNSTYMAASGLVEEEGSASEGKDPWQHLVDLINFALAIKKKLDGMNEASFNNFQLRIGISHGPVVAGVIGAKKPHYDIWGNTVNIASRMDSTGEPGKIQVLKDTRDILEDRGFQFNVRGYVYVKGKGKLLTYMLSNCPK